MNPNSFLILGLISMLGNIVLGVPVEGAVNRGLDRWEISGSIGMHLVGRRPGIDRKEKQREQQKTQPHGSLLCIAGWEEDAGGRGFQV